jgi:DNA-binding MarR family transcriptional regulator
MRPEPDNTELAAELRLVLSRINSRLRLRTSTGLTPSQTSIIATLAQSGPLNLGELARREAVRAPSASRAVDMLEELKLVQRTTDADDGRRQFISLTADGDEAAMRTDDARTRQLTDVLGRLTPGELDALRQVLPVMQVIVEDLSTPGEQAT